LSKQVLADPDGLSSAEAFEQREVGIVEQGKRDGVVNHGREA
jgi:hypothetical protein